MIRSRIAFVAGVLALLVGPAVARAQVTDRTIMPDRPVPRGLARFPIERSPIQLTSAVRPGEYVGVTGPRSAWLGLETGEAELWVHPLKVASDVRLAFRTPAYGEAIPGAVLARTIDVRPEVTTLTYSHAAFQVRQHILTPTDAPGVLMLLEVDSPEPLDVLVEFRPVLQYMWPGGLGGQYAFWDGERSLFVISESLQEHNAMLGSPWATNAVEHPAHALGEAPATMVIPVDPDRARSDFIPIALAGGTASRDSVYAVYARLLADAQVLYEERRDRARAVLETTTAIDSPDDRLDLALAWAKVNLEEQRVCNPDLGCGFVAGWGRSRSSARPGFGWFFGGDAAINTLAMDVTGQWAPVAEALRFLARYQRADGKIPHEVSQAAAHLRWFEDFPYPYYHADTTPYWMVALWQYWRASGDDATLAELWPAYVKAWEWCLSAETDGDGIIENTVGGYGAIEVGDLGEALHQDIYLASVWVAALEATQALAAARGDRGLERRARELGATARRTLNDAYWREGDGHHAFGILASGATNDNLTAWPATAASFGLLEPDRAARTLVKLATDSISADWGAHMLSTGSDLFDPLHYNNGTVWPFVTGFVSWGQYRYRRPWAGVHLMEAVAQITFDWSRGRHAELFSGTFYQPLDETVPHQFFATSMLVTPLLRGLVGFDPDAAAGRATLAPQLPPAWPRLAVDRLRVGEVALDVEIQRMRTTAGTQVSTRIGADGPVQVDYRHAVPLGAEDVRVRVDGVERPAAVEWGRSDGIVTIALAARGSVQVDVTWNGGLEVAPPALALTPGQRSTGLRIADFTAFPGGWRLLVEGEPDRTYDVPLFGAAVAADGVEIQPREDAGAYVARVRLPDGPGRTTRILELRPLR